MVLIARIRVKCTHRYDNGKRGVVYSTRMLNESPPRYSAELVTIVVHDPPEHCVSIAPGEAELSDESRSPDGNLWIIEGLFRLHARFPKGKIPVLHANAPKQEGVQPNAVFLRCSNRSFPTSDLRHTVQLQTQEEEACVFVDNHGPVRRFDPKAGHHRKYFSNLLVGVVPLGTIIYRRWWSRVRHVPYITHVYKINPETGALERIAED